MREILKRMSAVFAVLILWQMAAFFVKSSILLCGPLDVLKRLCTIWKEPYFAAAIFFTLRRVAEGFFLGLLLGAILAFLAGKWSPVRIFLWPLMAAVKAVPVAAIVVICLIWLSGRNLSVFLSFLVVCPVVYQNLLTGIDSLDPGMEEVAVVFCMTPVRRFRFIRLPQLFPYFTAACKVTSGMAWKAGIAAEIIATPAGSIGKQMYLAKTYLQSEDLLSWAVIIVALSMISEKLLMGILRKASERLGGG